MHHSRGRHALAALAAGAVLGVPALAGAQATHFRIDTTVAPGGSAALTIGPVATGRFVLSLRASSDGAKPLVLTAQPSGGHRVTLLSGSLPAEPGPCTGAAGTLYCTGLTTPASPGGRSWTFRLTSAKIANGRPISITLTVVWHAR